MRAPQNQTKLPLLAQSGPPWHLRQLWAKSGHSCPKIKAVLSQRPLYKLKDVIDNGAQINEVIVTIVFPEKEALLERAS